MTPPQEPTTTETPIPADRPGTALLIVDVQEDVVRNGHNVDEVVANINTLVDRARSASHPVIWVQHADDDLPTGSPGWEIIAELSPAENESVIHKNWGDSFEATDLDDVLTQHNIGTLVVAGAQTEWCIRSTLHGALTRGYNATLVSDAHTTDDLRDQGATLSPDQMIEFTNGYWKHSNAPGRACATTPTSDITF